jgi:hypothetical protein
MIKNDTPAANIATIDAWRSSRDTLRGVKKIPPDAALKMIASKTKTNSIDATRASASCRTIRPIIHGDDTLATAAGAI